MTGIAIAENQEMGRYGLFLSPKSCLLSTEEITCDLRLVISWETSVADDYCLYYKDIQNPIRCWHGKQAGNIDLLISRKESLNFELWQQRTQKLVYQAEFKLLRKVANVRHKRRNPWSFF